MKIKKLFINNFLAIKEAKINLEDIGLCLIQGENHSDTSATSNGAGKSTILDAISWVLYGVTSRGVSADAVINNLAKKDCFVRIIIMDGEKEYEICRGRKCSLIKNSVLVVESSGDTSNNLTGGTDKLTQEVIDRIIGCNEEVFNQSVYAGQERMPCLPSMTDKQLKLLVEDAAGINTLQNAQSVAEARVKESLHQLEVSSLHISRIDADVTRSEQAIEQYKEEDISYRQHLASKAAELKTNYNTVRTNLKAQSEYITAQGFDGVSSIENIAKLMGDLSAQLSSDANKKKELAEFDKAVNKIDLAMGVHCNSLTRLNKELDLAHHKLDTISEQVGVSCRTCGKETEEKDLEEVRNLAKEAVIKLTADINTVTEQRIALEFMLETATDARESFRSTLIDVSEAVSTQAMLVEMGTKSQKAIAVKLRMLEEGKRIKVEYEDLVKTKEDNQHFLSEVERLTAVHKGFKSERFSAEVARDNIETQIELGKAAVKIFGRGGIRAEILDSVTPILNEKTAEYLSMLTDGRISATWSTLTENAKGELVEKFVIEVEKEGGADNFKGLSGGEKRKVRLSTSLALQDLVSMRASKPIEFRFYDEVDTALDDAGVERLLELLKEKSKSVGTMLIVSHNNLSDVVSNTITVMNDGTGSVIL